METRKTIVRVLGAFVLGLAVGVYTATLSMLIMGILVLMAFLLGLADKVPTKYGMAVVSGLAFGAGIASVLGWATPVSFD